MRILSIGGMNGLSNTCLHRHWALEKIADEIDVIDTYSPSTLKYKIIHHINLYSPIKLNLPDPLHINKKIIKQVQVKQYDLIWIDKGNIIYPSTLKTIKKLQPNCILVHYMIDDIMNPHHMSKQIKDTIPLYDYYIMNRDKNKEELLKLGCKHPIIVPMSYENTFHYPRQLTSNEIKELGGEVGFIGTFEKERSQSILYLVDHGIPVRVWGNGWEHLKNYSPLLSIECKGLFNENFCKAIAAFKINLGFLRKKSRDLHTTRSTEIPACGGFLLAERTSEHQAMFKEGEEAEFFSSNEELLEKCKYYLSNEEERKQIAATGLKRCQTSGYSNIEAIKKIISEIIPSIK